MKSLYAEFTALPGNEARVAELLEVLTIAVRSEPGNLVFDAYRKTAEPSTFFVYEIYKDEDSFIQHLGQEHGRVFNAELADLVAGGNSTLTWLTSLAGSGIDAGCPAHRTLGD